MNQQAEINEIARTIIDANLYMTLGTADESGQPWVTPVYYASADYKEFYWISRPETQHSRNLVARPQLSIVIFDSHAPINTGQAVYIAAVAEVVTEAEIDRALDIYSHSALAHGGRAWTKQDALAPASFRLYRATASQQWILDPTGKTDHRVLVML